MAKKDTFYFPHDYNATQDSKMLRLLSHCGLEGVGAYWVIVEILHQQPDGRLPVKVFEDHISMYYGLHARGESYLKNICSTLVSTGLFQTDGNDIYSDRVLLNKKYRENIAAQRSKAGQVSASKRFRTHVQRTAKSSLNNERKVKEVSNTATTIASYWNNTDLPKIDIMNQDRVAKIALRWRSQHFRDNWQKAIDKLNASSFAKGGGKDGWIVSIDWFVANDTNYVKTLEGKYDDREKKDIFAKY